MNYGTAGQANALEKRADKPRLAQQLEQLDKVLTVCHGTAQDLERATDRILGPMPQDASKDATVAAADTVERKLAEVIACAEFLSARLIHASNRLNTAV